MERKEVAVGMDGCVYKPAFSCNEEHTYDDKQYISKLMSQEKVDNEIEKYKELKLNKLDPNMDFFISQPELCNLSREDITSYNFLPKKKCKINNPLIAVNYLDGGIDLFTILKTINYVYDEIESDIDSINPASLNDYISLNDINNILKSFMNILKGVELLNKNNILHFDIKPDNIVIDINTPEPKFKLIDFGLSRNISQHPPTGFFGTTGYIPPEMYMIGDIEKNYNDFLKKAKSESPEIIKILKEKNINANYYKDLYDLDPILFYEKADVWAIGMTLLKIYNIIIDGINLGVLKSTTISIMKIYNVYLKNIIDEMINPNVDERLTIEEAVEVYGKFLTPLNQIKRLNEPTKLSEYLTNPPPELLEYLNGSSKTKSIQRRVSMGGKRIKRRYATKKKKYRKNKKKNTRKR